MFEHNNRPNPITATILEQITPNTLAYIGAYKLHHHNYTLTLTLNADELTTIDVTLTPLDDYTITLKAYKPNQTEPYYTQSQTGLFFDILSESIEHLYDQYIIKHKNGFIPL